VISRHSPLGRSYVTTQVARFRQDKATLFAAGNEARVSKKAPQATFFQ
jgi:hypothetical protein